MYQTYEFGAMQMCVTLGRYRNTMQVENSVAKLGFDTAENEPSKVVLEATIAIAYPYYCLDSFFFQEIFHSPAFSCEESRRSRGGMRKTELRGKTIFPVDSL